MNKLLKLTGVSMLAIMTATNANAAGYTCEELVEYTSCNPGYSLTVNDTRCPDGYMYLENMCHSYDYLYEGYSREACENEEVDMDFHYYGNICVEDTAQEMTDGVWDMVEVEYEY